MFPLHPVYTIIKLQMAINKLKLLWSALPHYYYCYYYYYYYNYFNYCSMDFFYLLEPYEDLFNI